MYIFFALVLAVIALFLFSLNNDNYSGAGRLKLVGLLFFFVACFLISSAFTLKSAIKERERIITTEETARYELLPFRIITSTPMEIEISDSEILNNAEPLYYVRRWDANNFGFYYKTIQNGVSGFEPGYITFYSDNEVFITDIYEGSPVILKITETSKYPISKFEKFWLSSEEIYSLRATSKTRYEIYVPEDSIIETFNFEQ